MSIFKTLLKDTFIYGLAMVMPKLMNLLLVGLHTENLSTEAYSENTSFYVYAAFANVLLTYGMETAFFRFFSKSEEKEKVFTTVLIALLVTTICFFAVTFLFIDDLALKLKMPVARLQTLLGITVLDTLAIVPFVYYRIKGYALKFASVKLVNLGIYVVLNLYFLWAVPKYAIQLPEWLLVPKVFYIFIANIAASAVTFLLVFPNYIKYKWEFDSALFKQMLRYSLPIMVAGIAFVINENLDKLVLRDYLGKEVMGAYSGCYKLTVFLTLFIQAFRMGVEPFVFNHSKSSNAKQTYAMVLKFFVIFASLGLLLVLTFLDFFKELLIRDESYWVAISIVPIVLLANWCLGVYHSLSVWYKLTDKTHYGMYISIFGALITIVINYIFVPKYGFIAAAYATLAAYGTMMVISYVVGQRYYKIPYDISRLASYIFLALLFSMVTWFWFPEVYLIKFLAVLLYLGIIIIFEKTSVQRMLTKK